MPRAAASSDCASGDALGLSPADQTELLYALLLEGRGLLEQRAGRPRSLRRHRSGSEARGVAARLAARARAARRTPGNTSARAARSSRSCAARPLRDARTARQRRAHLHGALRARRRDRAHDRLLRARARRHPRDGRALGRRRLPVRPDGRPGVRSSRASSAWRRSWKSSGATAGRRTRSRSPASAAAGGSIPISSTRCEDLEGDSPFWGRLGRRRGSISDVLAHVPAELEIAADDARLDRIADAFALIIDAKSPFTFDHSRRVADVRARDQRAPR